jgi:hypothetical protein
MPSSYSQSEQARIEAHALGPKDGFVTAFLGDFLRKLLSTTWFTVVEYSGARHCNNATIHLSKGRGRSSAA